MSVISTLSVGKAGFGRDASIAFFPDSNDNRDVDVHSEPSITASMVVTCLDLQGQDSLQTMRARLGVYDYEPFK